MCTYALASPTFCVMLIVREKTRNLNFAGMKYNHLFFVVLCLNNSNNFPSNYLEYYLELFSCVLYNP